MTQDDNQHQAASAGDGRRLLSSAEFKRRLGGISDTSRWRREKAGIGPRPIKLNGRNFYVEAEVLAYLDLLAADRDCEAGQCSSERIAAP